MLSKLLSKLSPHSPTIIDATASSSYSSLSSNSRSQDDLSTALAKHNTAEAHLAQVENRLKNWSIPKLEASQVYKINTFNFSQQDIIVITEENVAMKDEFTAIKLLPEETLLKVRERFKYLHIGCVQVALKPLFREGLDVPVYLALRDKRHLRFTPSLLGIVQSNLEQGPVYFNCRPGLTVSLQDKNIMDTISLDVHSQGLELKDGSLPFAVSYRIYFKLMHTNLSPKALGISPKGYTMLMEVNVEKSSMTIPRNLKWDELTKNPIWKLQGEIAPIKRSSTEASITEFPDGNVEVQFNTGISYPRISEIMSSRQSTSSIKTETSYRDTLRRSESIRASVDFSHTIPDVHYEKEDRSLSPTQSDMERRSEPVYNQINVISDEKERFREHYSVYIDQWIKAPAETRKPFLTMPDFIEGMLKLERAKNEALVKKLQADGQIAMIKGSTVWVTVSGKEVASNYPPEEEAYFPHPAIPAIKMISSPYKTINEDKVQKVGVREIKNIQHQLNFTNKILSTVSKAVERIENPGLPLKNKNPKIPQINPNQPIFQPNSFNIGKLKEDASDYLAEINKRLAAISLNKDSKAATEGQGPKGINMIKKDSLPQASDLKILPVAQWVDMKNHYPQPSPPDLGWDDLHHEKRTYDGQSLITWNIDGYSEAQMMNTFQEMLLAATAYSTKKSTYETAQILILGFNGNLRSWWHNLLTEQDRQRILTATRTVVKTENTSTPIQVEEPDMVNQLLYTMTKHFIGSTQIHLNLATEALLGLKYHKMSRYKWYKDTFMARLYTLTTCGADIWKQKFVEGLPHYISQKFYQTMTANSVNQQIDWANLTYGDISSTVQMINVNLCTENKHTTKVIKDSDYRKELGTFCKQYGLSQGPKEEKKKKKKRYSSKKFFRKGKVKDQESPQRRRHHYYKGKGKKKYSSKTNTICFKCNQKGHYANRCPLKDKINALTIDEETKQSLLYAIRMDDDTSSQTESSSEEDYINILQEEGSSSEEEFYSQSDSSDDEGAIPCTGRCAGKCSGHINVITKDQETLFYLIEQIPDEEAKRTCLLKLKQSLEEQAPQKAIQNPIMYSYQDILNRVKGEAKMPIQVEDLHHEVKTLKREVAENKQRLIYLENAFQAFQESQVLKENSETSRNDFERKIARKALLIDDSGKINSISKVHNKKWMSKIVFKVKDFQLETLALIDSGADQNVIQEGLVPSKYFEKTKESLSRASGNPLNIQFKLSRVHICKGDVCLVNTFILVKNLNEGIILGTPFLTQLYPFHVTDKGIVSRKFDKEITFEFTHPVTPKYISNIEEEVRQFINRIARKEKHIEFLQDDIKACKVAIEIQKPLIQSKIENFQKQLEKEVCSSLPNAFWDRKKHMVTLPYEDGFKEAQIPTKARPIQMNKDLVKAEKERGVPRLVINYKPLNKVLKWIRYPIPNRQDLLKRITLAKVFSKFDMMSGFWQIQIHPSDRYKKAFNVPFGQFQWNVMPFGLKNAPSEFQKIMNDIFNQYQEFTIVYIDDVLVFSNTVDQHFKHLRVFLNVIKSNGLVVSQPKIKLFQTKIRFLGYEINQGIIKPIQQSLEFVDKFPDVIQDKTQLQRFLGCVNYIGDFIRDLRSICLPLYDRLKKNPKPWTDEHTRAVQSIKSLAKSIPCLSLVDEQAKLIIDTDASDIGYGGILKQELNGKISIVRYHSGIWNSAQRNYSTVKKEVLAIVLSVQKFQGGLINKEFLVRTDSKARKFIFEKDVKNLISKQIFARWQAILSCFDFKIEPIKGSENSLADYLSREHLLKTPSALNSQHNGTTSWPATATEPAATAARQSK
ncbi:Enzymatic polyprotein [Cucumis melo var. makuwa]|uniref:Enzymatic polyprotein n=1 Tax=Cucumis melo var. makuwa TaxID=1194695 RepID=A0A5A7UF59_CUCMM|nr:Enzymatic polyprotein [Cucumis melo var. makuwa]